MIIVTILSPVPTELIQLHHTLPMAEGEPSWQSLQVQTVISTA